MAVALTLCVVVSVKYKRVPVTSTLRPQGPLMFCAPGATTGATSPGRPPDTILSALLLHSDTYTAPQAEAVEGKAPQAEVEAVEASPAMLLKEAAAPRPFA